MTVKNGARAFAPVVDGERSGAVGGGGGAPVDPLAALSDDFESGATMTGNGWSIEDSTPSATPSDVITAGEADLTIAAGGNNGSLWFDGGDGALWYKTVDGACELRARCRVRNAADTGVPPTANFRIGGICAHDPDRSTYEYVHVGIGALSIGSQAIEWKSTDNSDSAYAGTAAVYTGGEFLYDLRLVRRASDVQVFDLYARAGTVEDLDSDTGWTLVETVDRTDALQPDRAANNGTVAVALPDVLRWGFMLYAAPGVPNIRMFVDECIFSTPTV